MIELLIALLLISISLLGVGRFLVQSNILEQQAAWVYQATLAGRNSLTSCFLSWDGVLEGAGLVGWQTELAETFPNSRVVLEKTDNKVSVQCLPPPGSILKVIELEGGTLSLSILKPGVLADC